MSSEVRLIEDWREKWEPVTRSGSVLVFIADTPFGIRGWAMSDEGMWSPHESQLIPIPQPKKLRPWKREEVPVGSVVRRKKDEIITIISCCNESHAHYVSLYNHGANKPETVLEDFVRHDLNPDGSWKPVEQCRPCGVEE